jgi:hypothetical protein
LKVWSTIKLVVISIVALIALTLLTVEPPEKLEKKDIVLQDMPETVELIGFEDQKFAASSIIKKDTIIFVGNHESIVIANDLHEMLDLPVGQFVIVSNISDAPWFIKRWQAHTQNTKLKGEKHLPWIYDRDGKVRNFLQVPTSDAVKYFVYKVMENGTIQKIYNGQVQHGTIEGKITKGEIKESLTQLVKLIKEDE